MLCKQQSLEMKIIMSVFIRPVGNNNIFHFFEDKESSSSIKTISYLLNQDGLIKDKW